MQGLYQKILNCNEVHYARWDCPLDSLLPCTGSVGVTIGLGLASAISNCVVSPISVAHGRDARADHRTLICRGDTHVGTAAWRGKVARGFSQGKAAGKQREAGLGIKINKEIYTI